MNGLGIRSQAELLTPAWMGCFVQACEVFTNRANGLGEAVLPGSFPLFGRLFGDSASDMGRRALRDVRVRQSRPLERTCATRALGSHARTRDAGGRHRAHDRAALTRRASGKSPSPNVGSVGGLQRPHAIFILPSRLIQHALCEQLEQRRAELLDEDMRRLPAVQTASMAVIPDPRLASWAEMCAILLDRRASSGTQAQDAIVRPYERRVQGDGRRLPWGPLAAGGPNRRWPPSPVPLSIRRTRTSRWTSGGLQHYNQAKSPAGPWIRGKPTTTLFYASSK